MLLFNFKKFVNSIRYAINGLKIIFKEEQSFRIQVLAAIVVVSLMFYFPLSTSERGILFLSIFLVLSLEIINSIFESTIDIFESRFDFRIAKLKDAMASAVLISSVASIIIGILIFYKYIF